MSQSSAIPPLCRSCGFAINDPSHVFWNGDHYHDDHVPTTPPAYAATIYKLTWGAAGHVPEQTLYFHCTHAADVAVRFAERVLEMDRNPAIGGAHASVERLPDSVYPAGMHLLGWTKTSNERPTVEGATLPSLALM